MTTVTEHLSALRTLADAGQHAHLAVVRAAALRSIPVTGAPAGSEQSRWERVRRGDREAFAEVVRDEQASLRRYAAATLGDAAEGDDVAQRVLLDLWEQRATTVPHSSLRAHLLVRARHLCLMRLRSGRRAARWEQTAAEQPHTPPPTPLDALAEEHRRMEQRRTSARIADLVDQLDEDARTAIWMRFAGGASFEEIGEALGRPPHAVRALVYRQLAALRHRLEEVPR